MGSILGRQTNFHRLTKENFAVMHLRLAATNGMQNLHLVFVCSNSSIFNLIVQFTFTVMVVPYYLGPITEIQFYILEKCQLKPIWLWIIAKMCIDIYMKCMDIRQSALISVKAVLEIELVCLFVFFIPCPMGSCYSDPICFGCTIHFSSCIFTSIDAHLTRACMCLLGWLEPAMV